MGRHLRCHRRGVGGRSCALLRQQKEEGLTSLAAIAVRQLLLVSRKGRGLPPAGGGISPDLTMAI